MEKGNVIDLQELFWALVDKWKVIFLAMLLGAFVFGLYHTFLMKPSYQADASIFITSNESVISVSDLQISSELTEDYAKITLVDIRYLPVERIGNYIDFKDQDVLFLYSTSVLNHSETLK